MTNALDPNAVLALIEAAGISVDDLVEASTTAPRPRADVPTVAEYLDVVVAATSDGARRTYSTYWQRLVEKYGTLRLDEVKTSHIHALVKDTKKKANENPRSNGRHGVAAQENCVGAARAFFRVAVEDDLISKNPAEPVPKPQRLPSRRRGFTDSELADLWRVTRSGGDDPVLDTLLLRFHLETGARRGGALNLRVRDLDSKRQVILLREKNDVDRWQPVSKTLLDALLEHARTRGASAPDDALLRALPMKGSTVGRPLTRKRYNTLVERWKKQLPWVAQHGVSIHWCRHHATSAIERIAGYAVARAFAGHRSSAETTTTYITAHDHEVAAAVAAYTSEPHPLAV